MKRVYVNCSQFFRHVFDYERDNCHISYCGSKKPCIYSSRQFCRKSGIIEITLHLSCTGRDRSKPCHWELKTSVQFSRYTSSFYISRAAPNEKWFSLPDLSGYTVYSFGCHYVQNPKETLHHEARSLKR